ncbi:hypothetical protein V8D89_004948 [Ganoderma adspersum]
MSSTSAPQPRIAIIGGGMSGLALLLTLHRRGVPATLYERDTDINVRSHLGGTLDLGWKSGQRALRENGLQEVFEKMSRPEADEMRICDSTGKLHLILGGETYKDGTPRRAEHIRPEIDRTDLRKLLLDAIPPHLIRWGHALSSVRPLGNGQHELVFTNGFTTTSDFLVGADGTHSHIRPLVSQATPTFLDVNGIEISLAPEVTKLPELAETLENVGKATLMAMQDSRMLGAQLNGDGRLRTYVWVRKPESWVISSDPAEAKAFLLEHFAGWNQWLLNLIEYCDESAIYPRPLFTLPEGHRWTHTPGATIIGDAAHLMSPFSGAGANLALLDGLELGLALAGVHETGKLGDTDAVAAAVAAFEEGMCMLAGRVAAVSNGNLAVCVGPDAPQAMVTRSAELAAQGEREG